MNRHSPPSRRKRPSVASLSRFPRLAAGVIVSLWPLFLFLLPLGLVGHLEETPTAPLLPYIAAAFASILLGAYLAKKAGVMT